MNKVAIILDNMAIGGIPKACASFVNQLVEYCDVTMIMRRDDGKLTQLLPREAHIQLIPHLVFRDIVKKRLIEHRYFRLIKYAIPYLFWSRVCNRWVKANELTAKEAGRSIDGSFDCVIAYHGMNISNLVTALYNVQSRKKIAWIHGDHPFEGTHKKDAEAVYRKFDKIYCVSPVTKERFLKDFPSVIGATDCYRNIIDVDEVRNLSEQYTVNFDKNYINIVTVGRVSPEKGQDLIPKVAKILIEAGYKIIWYIVGGGEDMERIRNLCFENGVQENIIFAGEKANPYPYMKGCDIYVQPSYTEGYCLTVCEAAALQKNIVLTADAALVGFLEDGLNSVITETNEQSIASGIKQMIDCPRQQERFISELSKIDLSNKREINKLLEFLRT